MFKLQAARERVHTQINSTFKEPDDELIITEAREKPYGWVFFYTSKRFLETDSMEYAIVGNGPIAFLAETGETIQLPSLDPEGAIAEFERERRLDVG